MINLAKSPPTIDLLGKVEPIKHYGVWWMVDGFGLYQRIQDALVIANGRPIQPMPVAVSDTLYEIIPPSMQVNSDRQKT